MLSKEKTIDVAKIIKNEKRLRDDISDMQIELERLNDSLNKLNNRYQKSLTLIETLSKTINKQYDDINELTERDLSIEKKKSNYGFYSYVEGGSTSQNFNSFEIGLKMVNSKTIYSLGIDPLIDNTFTIKFGIGLKIF